MPMMTAVTAVVIISIAATALRTVSAIGCYRTLTKAEYPFCVQLDPGLVLMYKTTADGNLVLAADVDGWAAWIAVGVSEAGLKGVDYTVLIRGVQAQTWVTGDYFSLNATMIPTLDDEQNAELLVAPVQDLTNTTLAVWTRPLDSCDFSDIPVFMGVERSLVWAYGFNKWDADKLVFPSLVRGVKAGVKLYTNPNATAAPDASASSLVLAMPSYPVPPLNSTYACVNVAVPSDRPYSIVGYTGVANTSLVHHMTAYACAPGVTPAGAPGAYECSKGVPAGCETVQMIWGPGAWPFVAPAAAGFLLNGTTTMVLQAHYQNPNGTVGRVDTSGFIVSYTPTLRANRLGVLTLGSYDVRIPPLQDSFQIPQNICPANCTGARVARNVTLVSNFFMMNRLGTRIITRHIRNNTAIQPLGRFDYFDAKRMGHVSVMPESSQLMPNDVLITLCNYTTANVTRGSTVYGGAANNELCFNYVTFYPVDAMPALDVCIADTRKNISRCATATALASAARANLSDAAQLQSGLMVPVGDLSIGFYRSARCALHDEAVLTPTHQPNTKGALASIILVPSVLIIIGAIIWSKYGKQEALEQLLEELAAQAEQAEIAEQEALMRAGGPRSTAVAGGSGSSGGGGGNGTGTRDPE